MGGEAITEDAGKVRDANRSKEAILYAAEELFAAHGFDGVSLGQIATAARLSRGTPSYFFGSKAQLYQEVIEQVFRDREQAIRLACQPLVAWASPEGSDPIERSLTEAVAGYLDFLLRRPALLKLVQREELASTSKGRGAPGPRPSEAIEEAFAAVRRVAHKRGLKSFEVEDAVLLFLSLTVFPLSQDSTPMESTGRDLSDPKARRRHVRFAVDQLLHLIGSGTSRANAAESGVKKATTAATA
jgi:AcrR family transcriptional regulator